MVHASCSEAEPFAIELWGDGALFSRPELSVERYSYDVPTPAAMSGLVKAIYWHPGIEVEIDRIHVINPIKHQVVRTNELGEKASSARALTAARKGTVPTGIDVSAVRQQRMNVVLRDVRYVVEGRLVPDPKCGIDADLKKASAILERRVRKGQCYRTPCFGCREYPAMWKPADPDGMPRSFYEGSGEIDLGIMRHSFVFEADGEVRPRWFHAVMRDGVVDVEGSEVLS